MTAYTRRELEEINDRVWDHIWFATDATDYGAHLDGWTDPTWNKASNSGSFTVELTDKRHIFELLADFQSADLKSPNFDIAIRFDCTSTKDDVPNGYRLRFAYFARPYSFALVGEDEG
ncbi:hypothetical protein FHS85_001869 [Rhodoligotrophos appendicifer]|uniref:hypothetical protein n=1 Tax=Rhodoligotrophos appendicifer TaxID=987056 RepID=UPI0011848B52|nr:hypothetical protein [Rhodoligotrophos appendicifer]